MAGVKRTMRKEKKRTKGREEIGKKREKKREERVKHTLIKTADFLETGYIELSKQLIIYTSIECSKAGPSGTVGL